MEADKLKTLEAAKRSAIAAIQNCTSMLVITSNPNLVADYTFQIYGYTDKIISGTIAVAKQNPDVKAFFETLYKESL